MTVDSTVTRSVSKQQLLEIVDVVLDDLHRQQCERAMRIAHRTNPRLTTEDLLNPDNFPALMNDPKFTYEDGAAAGILAAKIAVRSILQEKLGEGRAGLEPERKLPKGNAS